MDTRPRVVVYLTVHCRPDYSIRKQNEKSCRKANFDSPKMQTASTHSHEICNDQVLAHLRYSGRTFAYRDCFNTTKAFGPGCRSSSVLP